MSGKLESIVVLLRETADPNPPTGVSPYGRTVDERGLRRIVNPADMEALELALRLAEQNGATVTALMIGPPRFGRYLKNIAAMGVGRVIRVWDGEMAFADTHVLSKVLARCLGILGPDLILGGSRLLDRGEEPTAMLAAASLFISSCNAALEVTPVVGGFEVLRKGDAGSRQRIKVPRPAMVLVEEGSCEPRYPDLDALLGALDAEVEVWSRAELGMPAEELGFLSTVLDDAGYSFPRPNPLRVSTPDASLPSFHRIKSLLSGGIQPREGKIFFGSAEEVATELEKIFMREGLLPESA